MPVFETRIAGEVISPLMISGVRIIVGIGIPLASVGSNTNLYIDEDGAKSSYRPTVYQKQAGSWVAVA